MKSKIALITLSFVLLHSGITYAAPWEEKFFNPKALPDDVILPFPCEGSMVFRKVAIPVNQPLQDYNITLGQEGDDWGYLEQTRTEHIAGSFTEKNKGRYFLMAKYPVTDLQYAALENTLQGKECPTPSNKLRLPKVNVSWYDAMQFSDKYNLWLREKHPSALPVEDGAKGFARLPTETEWEFAERGGLSVSASDFRDTRFPMPEGIRNYVWSAGAQSANGDLQLTGLLHPNPLGLHDMLGNVSEMMFEPFRLNKLDRQHGQAGGFIVRGGSYLTPESDIRSAWRQEEAYYTDTGPTKNKYTGFRLVIVSPTLTSRDRIKEIEKEWLKLGSDSSPANGQPQVKSSSINNLSAISAKVQDEAIKQKLTQLKDELKANAQLRDEQRDQAIRTSLQLGAFLCTKLKDDGEFYDRLADLYEKNCAANAAEGTCEKRKSQLEEHKKALDFVVNYYADTLVDMATTYDASLVKSQVNVVKQMMEARGKSNLQTYLSAYVSNLDGYWKNGKVSRNEWLDTCKKQQ
ncbi:MULTISPECIES: formylglycine-generating enzyme family protein [Providencia]|uniref:SUMF1/EgtB/PvdO family nonheme iron enzyme n=1 Tax=Providencia rettgeri TaxID=587 RepID=A0AB35LBF1_PRORE|nr:MULTISPECIES: SUMF1/EgtB/PvdO family nonheme iron enzyme [Providencia]EJD6399574.1 SUMF1/EgtB/PvdO family nonheme iron enzyme [Providencia rettgeri]ELQ1455160.1 SUMF1/EgtB/PvdO family nonheme iron enzyme [Providencia rettgeri]MBT0661375.1 formylglycine-generating enzyme family protein [Providencia rettgeri]MCB4856019.1 formylglycine-generating enzyme family protein [Providencia rettgeri]MCD6315272.1 formylglycine-generating enzyme family protein [Providencia rettgeri]